MIMGVMAAATTLILFPESEADVAYYSQIVEARQSQTHYSGKTRDILQKKLPHSMIYRRALASLCFLVIVLTIVSGDSIRRLTFIRIARSFGG
jgi:hypothetical protein